jgi:ABC-type transporter MlaC component
MKALVVGVAVALWAAGVMATAAAQPRDTELKAAAEPIMKQLEAFRRDDYDAAYTFASEEIRQLFDRAGFERMVRGGYPEIARSAFALIAHSELAPDGHAHVRVKIRGANGNGVEALYDMVQESGAWRINGVVTRPDPGMV